MQIRNIAGFVAGLACLVLILSGLSVEAPASFVLFSAGLLLLWLSTLLLKAAADPMF